MMMDGDALGRHLMQLAAACRKCGVLIKFQEGATLAKDKGIHDQVVMCKKCQAVYTVNVTPRALTLVADVTKKYSPDAAAKQSPPGSMAGQDIARMRSQRDTAGLARALEDKDAGVQEAAAIALAEIGDDDAVKALTRALRQDEQSTAMQFASIGLRAIGDVRFGKTGRVQAVNALGGTLRSTNLEAQSCAAVALIEIGDTLVVKSLSEAIRELDPGVRKAAALALAKIGSPEAIEALTTGVRDADAPGRAEIALALQDQDANVRARLVSVLREAENRDAGACPKPPKKPWWRFW